MTLNQPRTQGRHPPPPLVSVSFPVSLLEVQSDRTALRYCAGQSPHRLLTHALTGPFLRDRSKQVMARRPKAPSICSFALGRRENVVTAHSTLTNTNSTGPKAIVPQYLGSWDAVSIVGCQRRRAPARSAEPATALPWPQPHTAS